MNVRPNPMQLLQMFQSAQNPQQMFQNLITQNPQIQTMMSQMQNSTNNASPENIAMQLAQQRGIPKEQILQMHSQLMANHK